MTTRNLMNLSSTLIGLMAVSAAPVTAADAPVKWESAAHDGRIEAKRGESLVLAWQVSPLADPKGGLKFAGSAFFHPLRTPSGFEWTTIQPPDHLHHFGLWWPWKSIEVEGQHYNCWEIQEGQGAHVAKEVKLVHDGPDKLEWEFHNETNIKSAGKPPKAVIAETARVSVTADGADTNVIDISLEQHATGSPVTITNYRYSGFSWRGPRSWNKENSRMLTSEGLDRDHANGKPARWVLVSGATPTGSATVLMMSAAADLAKSPECLRVWDSKTSNGAPFANFNPVTTKALPLDDAHPAVSKRKYRVIAADRTLDAEAAETAWRKWLGKKLDARSTKF